MYGDCRSLRDENVACGRKKKAQLSMVRGNFAPNFPSISAFANYQTLLKANIGLSRLFVVFAIANVCLRTNRPFNVIITRLFNCALAVFVALRVINAQIKTEVISRGGC